MPDRNVKSFFHKYLNNVGRISSGHFLKFSHRHEGFICSRHVVIAVFSFMMLVGKRHNTRPMCCLWCLADNHLHRILTWVHSDVTQDLISSHGGSWQVKDRLMSQRKCLQLNVFKLSQESRLIYFTMDCAFKNYVRIHVLLLGSITVANKQVTSCSACFTISWNVASIHTKGQPDRCA